MIFKCILLSLSASVDALTLGITYGIKNTKISQISNIIIFAIVFICSVLAIFIGHHISLLFSNTFSLILGSSILIILGIYNIYKGKNNINIIKNFDIDNSNYINNKEAIALGLSVAIDASCVSLSSGVIGYGNIVLPFFMAILHTLFINCGNFIAKAIVARIKVPSNVLSVLSGSLLVIIGILRIIY